MRIISKPVHIKIKLSDEERVVGIEAAIQRWKESIAFTPRSLYIHFARDETFTRDSL